MKISINPKIKQKISLASWLVFFIFIGIFSASFALSALKNIRNEEILQPDNNLTAATGSQAETKEKEGGVEDKKSRYFYINKNTNGQPKISAKAFLAGDLNTGEVILSQNQNQKFPIASTSKLMTALVARKIARQNDTVKIDKTVLATKGKNGELKLGEKIKIADLIYPLLLESSNDAAEALARYFGRDSFILKMNQEAERLQMTGTSYEDPSGLSAKNKSTPSDMFKLAGYIMRQQPDLFEITTKRSYSNKKHSWSNISQFLNKNGYLGGKSGYTDPAKQTAVSLFNLSLGQTGFRPIGITLLQSEDRRKDVETIVRYLNKNIYYGGETDANTNWVEERVGMPDIKDPNFLILSFAGDIMLDRGVRNSVVKNFNNDYSALFAKSKEFSELMKESDIFFANLEGTASDQGADRKNLYSFRMDPGIIPALKGAGINILSVANNHVGDWGRIAFIDTLTRLKENEIFYTGGGNNSLETETPIIIEKYGMKIGYLAFSDVGPNWMEAGAEKAGLLLANNSRFDEIIQNASKKVDYLIVSFHFGDEYKEKHNARQEYLAHRAVDNGAKIIIGSHPHVVEDTEIYKNSFIAYSLGNFIFDQSWSKPTMQGMLLELKLFVDGGMTVKKNITQLNSVFQLEKIIQGKEEKVSFQ